jgi:hypothetical protein
MRPFGQKYEFSFLLSDDSMFVMYMCDAAMMVVMTDTTYHRSIGGLGPKYWQY